MNGFLSDNEKLIRKALKNKKEGAKIKFNLINKLPSE